MSHLLNEDFRDFIAALNNNEVEYILVGGYAVILHGHARVTGDLDIWVNQTAENYTKLVAAFKEFRMPLFDMTAENFLNRKDFDVFSFGRSPVAIDIMTALNDFKFDECFAMASWFEDEGLKVRVIHINQLKEAKRMAGRPKDFNDLSHLPE
jgi:hypothetical protein